MEFSEITHEKAPPGRERRCEGSRCGVSDKSNKSTLYPCNMCNDVFCIAHISGNMVPNRCGKCQRLNYKTGLYYCNGYLKGLFHGLIFGFFIGAGIMCLII